jgi:dTDP-3-amino-3,4,6-trideoxy-alpha-D-glucose transaminase
VTEPRIPAVDFHALWADIGPETLAAVQRVGESGWYVLGHEVEEFERDLAAFHGVEHAVGCGSGLDAIELGLRAAGIGRGDVVLTTPLTAFATALAILRAGAEPHFVDVDAHGLLDLGVVERVLETDDRIRAIVPVHLYGHAVDVQRLRTLAESHGCVIVEDAAQAIGARSHGEPVGATTVGAATSFYPTKNLGALGDGGAFLTNDDDVATAVRQLRDYGQRAKYEHVVPGLNSRLDELHAGVLRTAVLPRLAQGTKRRRAVAAAYRSRIASPRIRIEAAPAGSDSVWHLFPVFVSEPDDREAFREHLSSRGIATAVHYPILAAAQQALERPRPASELPVADRLSRTEVSLPMHPYVDDTAVARVVDACNAW